jgi:hypothetical protein
MLVYSRCIACRLQGDITLSRCTQRVVFEYRDRISNTEEGRRHGGENFMNYAFYCDGACTFLQWQSVEQSSAIANRWHHINYGNSGVSPSRFPNRHEYILTSYYTN